MENVGDITIVEVNYASLPVCFTGLCLIAALKRAMFENLVPLGTYQDSRHLSNSTKSYF